MCNFSLPPFLPHTLSLSLLPFSLAPSFSSLSHSFSLALSRGVFRSRSLCILVYSAAVGVLTRCFGNRWRVLEFVLVFALVVLAIVPATALVVQVQDAVF
jgi:hypothetical protein